MIFWKLPKVSFLEIVTMRTVEPMFNEADGVLENLLFPKANTLDFRTDGTPGNPGALVPTGANEIDNYDVSVEHQIQQQGLSLNNISSSVSNLHDTMHDLKNAFTAMRIELNGPTHSSNEHELPNTDFDMVSTVLKELKSKADEIEKLKLEIEALKLRNRYVEEHTTKQTIPTVTVEAPLPEVETPGLLHGNRKRPYPFPEHYQGGHDRPIPESFDDEDGGDSMADFSLEEENIPSVKIPLRDHETTAEPVQEPASSRSPRLQIEVNHTSHETPDSIPVKEPPPKRPRLSSGASSNPNKKPRGRPPRKSSNQAQPDLTLNPKPTSQNEQNENPAQSTPSQQTSLQNRPGRSRSLRGRSRASSPNFRHTIAADQNEANERSTKDANINSGPPKQSVVELGKENANAETEGANANAGGSKKTKNDSNEKRKAQTAVRDNMAKLAMQREEAMDTEESR